MNVLSWQKAERSSKVAQPPSLVGLDIPTTDDTTSLDSMKLVWSPSGGRHSDEMCMASALYGTMLFDSKDVLQFCFMALHGNCLPLNWAAPLLN